jgi:alanyl-tRNA synthetase
VTQRLYYFDSQLREFEASVVERAEGGRRVYLDRTAFYPTSGGQPHDTGQLDSVEVTEVVDEGDRIAHVVSHPLSADAVHGRLDWARRFDHMQQHTGQHLLSAVVADLLGYATLSVHLGERSSTVDLDTAQLTYDQVVEVEERANELVAENRSVLITFEEATEALRLRKPTSRTGSIRVVTIADLDRSACGGTHVRATGEIGPVLLRKVERSGTGVRLEFLCGLRAVRHSRREAEVLTRLTAESSTSIDELPDVLGIQRAELKAATSARRELETALNQYRAKELYHAAVADSQGLRRTVVRLSSGRLDDIRGLGQAFAALPGGVFIGILETPPSVLLAAAAESGINAGTVLKGLLQAAGGRGGGSPTLAQGVLPGRAQLEQVVASLEDKS